MILNAWHFGFVSALVFTAQWVRFGGRVVHTLTRRYVYLEFKGLKVLALVLCPFGNSSLVGSANLHCRSKFLNLSARKTCQCSRVASLSGRAG